MYKKTTLMTGAAIALILGGLCSLVHAATPAPKAYIAAVGPVGARKFAESAEYAAVAPLR
jgi:hypothetical protein